MRIGRILHESLVLANGPVNLDCAFKAIILCDGPVTIRRYSYHSLILARGAVKCGPRSSRNVIVSGGTISVPDPDATNSFIKPKDSSFLGVVRFFELKRVGIEVAQTKGSLKVTSVRNGCFAKAGLRRGDAISAVEDQPVTGQEAFRKLVRGHFAEGTAFRVQYRRGGKMNRVGIVPGT